MYLCKCCNLLSMGYRGSGFSACDFLNNLLPRLLIKSNLRKLRFPYRAHEVEILRVMIKFAMDIVNNFLFSLDKW